MWGGGINRCQGLCEASQQRHGPQQEHQEDIGVARNIGYHPHRVRVTQACGGCHPRRVRVTQACGGCHPAPCPSNASVWRMSSWPNAVVPNVYFICFVWWIKCQNFQSVSLLFLELWRLEQILYIYTDVSERPSTWLNEDLMCFCHAAWQSNYFTLFVQH